MTIYLAYTYVKHQVVTNILAFHSVSFYTYMCDCGYKIIHSMEGDSDP